MSKKPLMNRIRGWIDPDFREAEEQNRKAMDEVLDRIESGEPIEKITVRIIPQRPEWDQSLEEWTVATTSPLPEGKHIAFIEGRGGDNPITLDRAIRDRELTESEDKFRYVVKFQTEEA